MGTEDGLRDALKRAALDLQQQTTSIRERELEEALVACLAESLPGSISRQAPLNLKGWPGVGNCDIAVTASHGDAPIFLELKWGAGTLYNCAWDAVKLALALHERKAKEAYLVAGSPLADWDSEKPGVDLFGSREWTMQDFMASYAKEFAFWRSDVKTHPELLPERFSTTEVIQIDMEIVGVAWSLRSARVSSPGGGMLVIDEDGTVSPLPSAG